MDFGKNANDLIHWLQAAGFEAFAVGGCIRDQLMGKQASDIDIATSALPAQCEAVLQRHGVRYMETGLKHGTVTALLADETFEITTFRTDGAYTDSRHPDAVAFVTDIQTDLARRDFTMNAIACNDKQGFVDPFGGQRDIENRVIRAVGDPNKRFEEDALRIMRAVRFASVLGFALEEKTKQAAIAQKTRLAAVSAERIYTELKKLLLGAYVFDALTEYKEIIAVVLPEIKDSFHCPQANPWHVYDVFTHIAKAVEAAPLDVDLRLTMLFHDVGKPACKTTDSNGIDHFYGHPSVSKEMARQALHDLKAPKSTCDRVLTLVELHDSHIHPEEKSIKKWLNKIGPARTLDLIDVKTADLAAQNLQKTQPEIEELYQTKQLLRDILQRGEPFQISDLAVNGFDLMRLGYQGKEIGRMLQFLLDRVISGSVPNHRETLLALAASQRRSTVS